MYEEDTLWFSSGAWMGKNELFTVKRLNMLNGYSDTIPEFRVKGRVAYLKPVHATRQYLDSVFAFVQNCDTLELDLRVGGSGAMRALNLIAPVDSVFALFHGYHRKLGKLQWGEGKIRMYLDSISTKYPTRNYWIKLLVNHNTQSHMEFMAMAYQSQPNVLTVGSPTAGADGNITRYFFSGENSMLIFSGMGITYPDSSSTALRGIRIDRRTPGCYDLE
jgi:hypothetical protein